MDTSSSHLPPVLDAPLQGSLFGCEALGLGELDRCERLTLDERSWVDSLAGWVSGADDVFTDLVARLHWRAGRRTMYERVVDVPRLTASVDLDDAAVPEVVPEMAQTLSTRYGCTLATVFANLYRSGADSVAWHGDRVGPNQHDPLVVVVSFGGTRRFLLRPRGGGRSHRFELRSGDLLVMGGSCQHRWEHSVPKSALAGPRISLTFRSRPDPRFKTGGKKPAGS